MRTSKRGEKRVEALKKPELMLPVGIGSCRFEDFRFESHLLNLVVFFFWWM